jgi:hypothetical protein
MKTKLKNRIVRHNGRKTQRGGVGDKVIRGILSNWRGFHTKSFTFKSLEKPITIRLVEPFSTDLIGQINNVIDYIKRENDDIKKKELLDDLAKLSSIGSEYEKYLSLFRVNSQKLINLKANLDKIAEWKDKINISEDHFKLQQLRKELNENQIAAKLTLDYYNNVIIRKQQIDLQQHIETFMIRQERIYQYDLIDMYNNTIHIEGTPFEMEINKVSDIFLGSSEESNSINNNKKEKKISFTPTLLPGFNDSVSNIKAFISSDLPEFNEEIEEKLDRLQFDFYILFSNQFPIFNVLMYISKRMNELGMIDKFNKIVANLIYYIFKILGFPIEKEFEEYLFSASFINDSVIYNGEQISFMFEKFINLYDKDKLEKEFLKICKGLLIEKLALNYYRCSKSLMIDITTYKQKSIINQEKKKFYLFLQKIKEILSSTDLIEEKRLKINSTIFIFIKKTNFFNHDEMNRNYTSIIHGVYATETHIIKEIYSFLSNHIRNTDQPINILSFEKIFLLRKEKYDDFKSDWLPFETLLNAIINPSNRNNVNNLITTINTDIEKVFDKTSRYINETENAMKVLQKQLDINPGFIAKFMTMDKEKWSKLLSLAEKLKRRGVQLRPMLPSPKTPTINPVIPSNTEYEPRPASRPAPPPRKNSEENQNAFKDKLIEFRKLPFKYHSNNNITQVNAYLNNFFNESNRVITQHPENKQHPRQHRRQHYIEIQSLLARLKQEKKMVTGSNVNQLGPSSNINNSGRTPTTRRKGSTPIRGLTLRKTVRKGFSPRTTARGSPSESFVSSPHVVLSSTPLSTPLSSAA